MRLSLVSFLLLWATACAPFYVPRAATLSMLEEGGDVHVSGTLGGHGAQADVTWAVDDVFAVRTGAHFAPTPAYLDTWIGFGPYLATGHFRLAFLTELGGGYANSTTDYTTGSTTQTTHNKGGFMNTGGVLEVGYENPHFGVGLSTRGTYSLLLHGPDSEGVGARELFTLEPIAVLQAGSPLVKFTLQAGFVIPVVYPEEADVGAFLPFRLGAGIVFNLPKRDKP